MRRREFTVLLGGAAAGWPLTARAQRSGRVRTIGIMPPAARDDPETRARLEAFRQGLDQLGWRDGANIRFEYRWPVGDPALIRKHAAELVAVAPDAIVAGITSGVQALKRETSTIPIVFANVADPVGSGLVPNMAKPGGNVTGFTAVEYAIVGKWLELLKEIAPSVERVALLGNPDVIFTRSFYRELEHIAPSFGIRPVAMEVRNPAEIAQAMEAFAREPNGGLLLVPEFTASIHRALIFRLATAGRVPVVAPFRFYTADGALASYGPDQVDQYRGAARYVDRILRGAKPADLPVQAPTKFELAVNTKVARALGLTLPATLLGRADEVIE